ncbi:hypothetical protein B0T19DRAFT_401603 [Cercophora scortea]|uniref:Rhodopsin domain-containing protein n=1 Tax=Cercophora scortea TaxID=314031 RepID=A0AAE0M8J1_9PEZI|nr:hypothetical protein B0T19DRAFT_401603 [Cercophora scortea]
MDSFPQNLQQYSPPLDRDGFPADDMNANPTARFWDLSPDTKTVAIVSVSLTWLVVLLRIFTRFYIVKAFGIDDKLMTVAMLLYTAFGINITFSATSRTGTLLDQLTNAEYLRVAVFLWVCFFYFVTIAIAKISIACFLLRLTRVRAHRIVVKSAVVGSCLFGFATMIAAMFQCKPVNFFWDKSIPGSCLNPKLYAKISLIINGVASLSSDLVLALTPAWMICNISVIARWVLLSENSNPNDPAHGLDVAGWTTLEQGLVISAGSLASVWPLARWARKKLRPANSPTTLDGTSAGTGASGLGQTRIRTSSTVVAASYQRMPQTVYDGILPIPLGEIRVQTRCSTTVEEIGPVLQTIGGVVRHVARVTAGQHDSVETLKEVAQVHFRS